MSNEKRTAFYESRHSSPGHHRFSGSGIHKHSGRSTGNFREHNVERAEGTSGGVRRFTPHSKYGKRGNFSCNSRTWYTSLVPATSRTDIDGGVYCVLQFFKIVAINGASVKKNYLLETIKTHVGLPDLIPVMFTVEDKNIVFYTDHEDMKDQCRLLRNFVILKNDQKIQFQVTIGPPPNITKITQELFERMKHVVTEQYEEQKQELDLSQFFRNPHLSEISFCPLNRPIVVNAVLNIIASSLSNLVSLNLSGNRLRNLSFFSHLSVKAPNLKKLDLSDNFINEIRQLEVFSPLRLQDIVLDGNPIKTKMHTRVQLEAAVRTIFSDIQTLDGEPLKQAISFDVKNAQSSPSVKGSYFSDSDIKSVVLQFLEEYLQYQDAPNTKSRQHLMAAYHDNAVFSMESCNLPNSTRGSNSRHSSDISTSLGHYIPCSRNLLKLENPHRCWRLLKRGKMAIALYLSEMPATCHDRLSLVIDARKMSQTLLICSLSGVFREVLPDMPAAEHPIRSFCRIFAIVSEGNGLYIVNEMYFISNPTEQQLKNSFNSENSVEVPQVCVPTPEVQEEMIASFAKSSGMNKLFSLQCLEDNLWDFTQASRMFIELKNAGKIPNAAFENQ